MLDAARDDDELPFLDRHAPISKLHREPALVDEEEFVLVLMNGPWNLTSFTRCPFTSPTIFGSQWDVKRENLCDRLTLSMRPPLVPLFVRQPARDPFRFAAPRPYHTPHSFTEYSVPSPRNKVTDEKPFAGLAT